jgi:hypothetical protein
MDYKKGIIYLLSEEAASASLPEEYLLKID